MNYLAHIYLSGESELITIGNFIADGIKGKNYKTYPDDIQIGILLHRYIDSYTDSHPTFRKSTKRLHKKYSHYSGIIVDMLYDHFLAKNWNHYSNIDLTLYAENFYTSLEIHYPILPMRIQKMIPYMLTDNWLVSYASKEGIGRALDGLNRRTRNKSNMNEAIYELDEFYSSFENEFTHFFNEVIIFSENKLKELKNNFNQ
mgnify:CR=1 FL=1